MLGNEALTIQSAGGEETLRYDQINGVRLYRKKDQSYFISIHSNKRVIRVGNRYYLSAQECEDRSRQYGTFVRILHHHLRSKGSPVYSSGKSLTLLLMWSLVAGFFSFLISFISEYFGISIINPFGQSLILTLSTVAILIAVNRGDFSRQYRPEQIPLQFLP